MSTTIDERVVEMRFDNRHFESNVETSIHSINKLKDSLDMQGATKGLEGIDKAARNVDMGALGSAVDAVQSKFSSLQIMAITALANITNTAVNAGKRIASALTIDPIKTGMQEYEIKMNAIQTIQANTRNKNTMADIDAALAELNEYADKTIYNFAQMTSNVGKFTAQGYDVKQATEAVKGLANLAAASGASAQDMARATYQMSQALGGTIRMIDWNSLRNANMATTELKNTLMALAKTKGIDVEAMVAKHGAFEHTLQEGWLTGEMFTEAMNIYSGVYSEAELKAKGFTDAQVKDFQELAKMAESAATEVKTFSQLFDVLKETAQSGWTQTWELIIGDFDTAKKMLTELQNHFSGILNNWADARNTLLSGWKEAGGRQDMIDSFKNLYQAIVAIIKPAKEAFREIFPPLTVQNLVNITKALKNFTESIKLGETASNNLKRTFKGFFAVLDISFQLLSAVVKAIFPMFKGFSDIGGGILELTAKWGDWMVQLNETIRTTGIFNTIFGSIAETVGQVATIVKKFYDVIKAKIVVPGMEIFGALIQRIGERLSGIGVAVGDMKSGVSSAFTAMGDALKRCSFVKVLTTIWDVIRTMSNGIAKVIGGITKGFVDGLGGANFDSLFDLINSLSLSSIAVFIAKFVKGFADVGKTVTGFKKSVIGILNEVRDCIKTYQSQIKAEVLKKIAVAIAILTGSLLVLSLIDSEKLAAALGAITVIFAELIGSMFLFNKIGGSGLPKLGVAMVTLSTSVLILSAALKKMEGLSWGDVARGLVSIWAMMMLLEKASWKLGAKNTIKAAAGLVVFGVAVNVLAVAVKKLGELDTKQLAKGLIAVGVLCAELSGFLIAAKFGSNSISSIASLLGVAAAVGVLAFVVSKIGALDTNVVTKGLIAIGVLLAELAMFSKLVSKKMNFISTATGILILAGALTALTGVMYILNKFSWSELGKGLASLGLMLAAVGIGLQFIPKKTMKVAVSLIAVAGALAIIAGVMHIIGALSWGEIGKGLLTIGASMLILAIGVNAMSGAMLGAASILTVAVALAVLAPVLAMFSNMSVGEIVKSLVTLASVFAVIGISAAVLSPLVPVILALSASVALLGVGLLACGTGLMAFSAGLTMLAAAGTAGAAGIVAIFTAILGLIPVFFQKIGEGLIALCEVIAQGAPAIGESVKAVVLSLLDVLKECVPPLVDVLLQVIVTLLDSLTQYTPRIVAGVFAFMISILDGVADNLPALIQAAVDVLMAFFAGVVQALSGIDTDTLIQGIAGVGLLAGLMMALAAVSGLVPAAMVGVLGMGVVIAELALVLAAVGALAQIPGLEWLISEGGDFLQTIGTAIGKFIGGIAGGIASGFTSSLPEVGTNLSNFMKNLQPFIDGAKSIDPATLEGVKTLTGVILAITAANILDGIAKFITGEASVEKFANELPLLGQGLKGFSDAVIGIVPGNVIVAAEAAKYLAEMAKAIPNEGGLWQLLAGNNNIAKFGEEIPKLGEGIKGFSDAVTGVSPEEIVAAAEAAKSLADLADAIPNEGGLWQLLAGSNNIGKFGTDLPLLGEGIKGFSDAVSGVTPESVVAASEAAKSLVEVGNELSSSGGLWQILAGGKDVKAFADNLDDLGSGIRRFAANVQGTDPAAVTAAAEAAKTLAEVGDILDKEGGLAGLFSGKKDLKSFADNLDDLGSGIRRFAANVQGMNVEGIAASAEAAKSLAEMAKAAPEDSSKLISFGENLSVFGGKIKGYFTSVVGVSKDAISSSKQVIETMKEASSLKTGNVKTTANSIESLTKALKNLANVPKNVAHDFRDTMKALGQTSSKALLEGFKNLNTDMKKIGTEAMKAFMDGVKASTDKIKNSTIAVSKLAATGAKSSYSDFRSAGMYVAQGFADGISSNSYAAVAKAQAMANAAARAARNALAIKSPSRVFYGIGKYAGIGFVNALSDYTDASYDAGSTIADSARKGLSGAINKINDLINSDIDMQPTIRPVLDLSSVESGASAIGGLLGGSVGVSANVGAISTMMGRRNQNGNNAEVVSAINGLRKDLENVNHTTNVIEGITYDDGSVVHEALKTIIQAAKIERRV